MGIWERVKRNESVFEFPFTAPKLQKFMLRTIVENKPDDLNDDSDNEIKVMGDYYDFLAYYAVKAEVDKSNVIMATRQIDTVQTQG